MTPRPRKYDLRIAPAVFGIAILVAATVLSAPAKTADPAAALKGFDALVAKALAEWKVPGLAISVVKDGRLIYAEGFGLRDVAGGLKVTPHTLFAIGSRSKAFTATTLGILVDEKKLEWDKPVRAYLPAFKLSDPVVSERMTPRDLVTHRSGLPRHDRVWYKAPLTRQELFDRLQYLELSRDLRALYQYNNLMFMTAGYLAGTIAGESWESLARRRILEPLGMAETNFSVDDSQKAADFALPYQIMKDKVERIPFCNIDAIGPAGAINSNVLDMSRWVLCNLAKGAYGDKRDKRIVSEAQLAVVQAPQMVTSQPLRWEELTYTSYAMGWMVGTYRGHLYVQHGGAIDGFSAQVAMLPRDGIGVVLLNNLNGAPVNGLLAYNVFDRLLGLAPVDWFQRTKDDQAKAKAEQEKSRLEKEKERKTGTKPSHPLDDYAGEFEHPAYGTVAVTRTGETLSASYHGSDLVLEHYHYDVFRMKNDLTGVDVLIAFQTDTKGDITSLAAQLEPTIKPIVFARKPAAEAGKKPGPALPVGRE